MDGLLYCRGEESPMDWNGMAGIVEGLVAPGKGLLAADESEPTDRQAFCRNRSAFHGRASTRLSRHVVYRAGHRTVPERGHPVR